MSLYRGLRKSEVDRRARALQSYSAWEPRLEDRSSARLALEGVGFLWELLPGDARERPVDTAGVQRMHAVLRRLRTGS